METENMPFVEVTLTEGRTRDQLRTLITRLTDAAETSLGAPRETIRVVLREVPPAHYAVGDVTLAESSGHRA
jgi:4-oxalocrotonate tautomerase